MNDIVVNNRNKIHPQKFALWAAMGSITMMFGAFTSAYIVKQAQGDWLEFTLPAEFSISTFVILLSSVVLHLSFISFKRANESQYKYLLVLATILGFAFVILQYLGWIKLNEIGVDLKGNVSGSFFYLISGVHALHVLGGIAAMIVAMIYAFRLKFSVTPTRIHRFDLVVNYWHFVDILWVYLFIFLIISK